MIEYNFTEAHVRAPLQTDFAFIQLVQTEPGLCPCVFANAQVEVAVSKDNEQDGAEPVTVSAVS